MEDDDLDLDIEGTATGPSQTVRKTINLKLRPGSKNAGRGRGRKPAKNVKKTKPESPLPDDDEEEEMEEESRPRPTQLSHDIQLSPVKEREPWSITQKITWNNKVNLIGEKVVDPMIHSCDICTLPILIYGRMIPCKHVFCFNCAKKTEKNCPRCKDSVQRIEQSALGTVFICSYGGSRHTSEGCKRTYLSARDLQAHISHRHVRTGDSKAKKSGSCASNAAATQASLLASTGNPVKITIPEIGSSAKVSVGGGGVSSQSQLAQTQVPTQPHPPPIVTQQQQQQQQHIYQSQTQDVYAHHPLPPQAPMAQHPQPVPPPASQAPQDAFRGSSIPVLGSRTNLISVPIQGVEQQEYKPQMQYPSVSYPQTRPQTPVSLNASQPLPAHSHAPQLRPAPPQSFHAQISHAGTPISYAMAPMSMPGPILAPSQLPTHPTTVVLPGRQTGPGGPPMPHPGHPPPMVAPPPVGPPPGAHPQGMPPPQRYPSPHRQYEETPMSPPTYSPSCNQPGGHSPRPPWPGSVPPRGPPGGPPGPPPPRPNVSAPPPPLRPPDSFQYFH